jgi:hypothetical protein
MEAQGDLLLLISEALERLLAKIKRFVTRRLNR